MRNYKALMGQIKTKEERIYAGTKDLYLFALMYFPHYFKEKSAPFHFDMCKDIDDLDAHKYQYLLEVAFRESAKTSFAKIAFIRNIVYRWSKMMFYTSYEQDIAENNLLDIALELQTNKFLINDFGQLFFDESSEKKSKKTGVTNFLTSNGVRVQASTVKKTLRGQVFQAQRPDFILMDDIENDQTKNSYAKTKTTINYIEEMMTGLAPSAKVIILGNRISDSGVIANLEERFRDNTQARIFEKALIEDGKITWNRFSWEWVENKRAILNKNGSKRFEQEYLNQPIVDGARLFDVDIIDRMKAKAKLKEFTEPRPRWKVWENPTFDRENGPHEYMIGVDISQGFGLDSSCIQVIDRVTGEQVAEYENNLVSPNDLVDEILWSYEEYNDAIVAPENNSIGQAVIAIMKERGLTGMLYIERKTDKITNKLTEKYGWNTNSKTKPKVIFDLQQALKDGDIIINSVPLLNEMRGFTNSDIDYSTFDPEASKHFDRVMAFAIAWQMRNFNSSFAIGEHNNLNNISYGSEIHSGKVIDKTLGIQETIVGKRFGQR